MPLQSLTSVETVTLLLSIIGTMTGVTSIVVTFLLFRWAGPRVRVEATNGVTLPPGSWNVTVRVTNAGRHAITVKDFEFQPIKTKKHRVSWTEWKGAPLPHRLEAFDNGSWRVERPAVLQEMLVAVPGSATKCRLAVILGNGRKVRSNIIDVDRATALKGLTIEAVPTGTRQRELDTEPSTTDYPVQQQGTATDPPLSANHTDVSDA